MTAQPTFAAAQPAGAQAGQPRDGGAWEALGAAADAGALCRAWLGLLAGQLGNVEAGAILLKSPQEGAYVPAAFWPGPLADLSRLTPLAQRALSERRGVELAPEAVPGRGQLAIPIEAGAELRGVIVLGLAVRGAQDLRLARERVLWGGGWLSRFFLHEQQARTQAALARAGLAMDLTILALEKPDFQEAMMALVNELAVKLGLSRAGLGLAGEDGVRLCAVSHSAHFKRQSEAMQALEQAMEEAWDQRRAVSFPALPGEAAQGLADNGDHERLARRQGGGAAASFLVRDRGGPVAVLTLEFADAAALTAEAAALAGALACVLGPVLADKRAQDRWFAGKARRRAEAFLDKLLGPGRHAFKLKAAALAGALAFLAFAQGEFRVPAKTVVEGLVQRSAVAPFEGYISQAPARAGDVVAAQQALAALDDKDLRLEQVRWQTERGQALGKLHEAQARHDRAAAAVLGAQLGQAEAQLGLIEEKLKRSVVRAPFDGVVVSGDWSQLLGAPVEQGKVLFEIAPLDAYRMILKVDERDIAYVRQGQAGELVLSGLAGQRLAFSVKKITSVTAAEEGVNYFRVEAQLDQPNAAVRPGMEGIGKILAGRGRLAWIWTRRLSDWLAVKLWAWLP